MEEYDLSYRLLNLGYRIIYTDNIVMLHKESPLGRQPNRDKMRMLWINKSKVAWRYLPLVYFVSTTIMWSMHYLLKSKFDLKGWFMNWRVILQIPANEPKSTVNPNTLKYLKQVEARLSYWIRLQWPGLSKTTTWPFFFSSLKSYEILCL